MALRLKIPMVSGVSPRHGASAVPANTHMCSSAVSHGLQLGLESHNFSGRILGHYNDFMLLINPKCQTQDVSLTHMDMRNSIKQEVSGQIEPSAVRVLFGFFCESTICCVYSLTSECSETRCTEISAPGSWGSSRCRHTETETEPL